MRRIVLAIAAVVLTSAAMGTLSSPAHADGIELRSQSAQNAFPNGGSFTLVAASGVEITQARLRYQVLPDGPLTLGRAQCNTGTVVTCTAMVGNTSQFYLVPGAEVLWSWDIEDASGNKLTTDQQHFFYQDTRFKWDSISDGNLTLYFYSGDSNSNRSILTAARQILDQFSVLEGTTIDFQVKVWIYQTVRDLQAAIGNKAGISPNGVVKLGEVSASDTALAARDDTSGSFLDTVRHEVAHIVTERASRGFLSPIPVWVNEGISVHAQRDKGEYGQALDLAVRRKNPIPVTSLNVAARDASSQVSLFYGESGSLIDFLVATYGDEKFAQFIAGFKNDTTDAVLQKVYGFDQLGLENAWRKSLGLPEVTVGPTTGSGTQAGIPTLAPLGSGNNSAATPAPGGNNSGGQPANNGSSDSGGGPSVLIIALGALVVALVLAGGGALLLMRGGSKPAA